MDNAQYGFLLVMMQPPPAMEEEFNEWYDTEHVPERLAVPGFLSARRFVSVDGHPRYLAMYDLERPDVLDSEAYKAVSGESSSPWTKRVTSRVLVDRRIGRQIEPGNALTGRASRLMVLRFHGIAGNGEAELVTTLREAFGKHLETTRLRVFACSESADHYVLVEAHAPIAIGVLLPRLGRFADALDLATTYAPYDPRL
ncbi:DUF4286 family protein [Chelativorans sp. Marseille-P2723]|uniref:DUF4286 family protein n=1 Tax=Chelativorans sp. Marseille-P2723 TaxID=2709133 RepID=UPI001570B80C|nr:DUF4286 family protein [Chelativorans sp. Marseille-P2723]